MQTQPSTPSDDTERQPAKSAQHDGNDQSGSFLVAADQFMRARARARATRNLVLQMRQLRERPRSGFEILCDLATAVDSSSATSGRKTPPSFGDPRSTAHSQDVLLNALLIARELGMEEPSLQTVQVAALLHDVGKIGVPDRILLKPGGLTLDEYESIKVHSAVGAALVKVAGGLDDAAPAVRHHHERWDGSGYPDGLRGDETPLIARVIAVADAYSAMTNDRPYRDGMSDRLAIQILREGAGTQWQPDVVQAFIDSRKTELRLRRAHRRG